MKNTGIRILLAHQALLWALSSPAAAGTATPNRLTLYFMPTTPAKLRWETPRSLLKSAILGAGFNRNHPIGHAVVEGSCEALEPGGRPIHFLTAATSESGSGSTELLIRERVGFGILTRGWAGRLEHALEIIPDLKKRSERPSDLSAVTFLLSREACHRIADYHHWIEHSPYPRYYGFAARPRHLEGGGCSAFAASFAEVAGVLSDKMRSQWSRTLRIPRALIARPERGERLGVGAALVSRSASRWAHEHEPHVLLKLFDPDLMHEWVGRVWNNPKEFGAERDEALLGWFQQKFGPTPRIEAPHTPILLPAAKRRFSAVILDLRGAPVPRDPVILGDPDPSRMDGSLEEVP